MGTTPASSPKSIQGSEYRSFHAWWGHGEGMSGSARGIRAHRAWALGIICIWYGKDNASRSPGQCCVPYTCVHPSRGEKVNYALRHHYYRPITSCEQCALSDTGQRRGAARLKRPPKTELINGEEHVPKGISIEKGVGGGEGGRNERLRAKEEKGCGLRDCTGSWVHSRSRKTAARVDCLM